MHIQHYYFSIKMASTDSYYTMNVPLTASMSKEHPGSGCAISQSGLAGSEAAVQRWLEGAQLRHGVGSELNYGHRRYVCRRACNTDFS